MKKLIATGLFAMIALVSPLWAQPAAAQVDRVWLDVDFGVANSRADAVVFGGEFLLFDDVGSLFVTSVKPSRAGSLGFGGGYMLTPRIGVGAAFAAATHRDFAEIEATVPHPIYGDAYGTGFGATDEKLRRREQATHVHLMVVPVDSTRVRVRAFGGPSIIRYRADLVSSFDYDQVASAASASNIITITAPYNTEPVNGTSLGFHVGGDVSYFLTRVFGVGGYGRYSRGTVDIAAPGTVAEQPMALGGMQFGAGVRFRF